MNMFLTNQELRALINDPTPLVLVCVGTMEEFRSQRVVVAEVRALFDNQVLFQFAGPEVFARMSDEYGIYGSPTYLMLHGEKLLGKMLGRLHPRDLREFVQKQLVELEMNEME